ncbi:MAG: TlpA family protein disulfide reductase [Alistipes sp.]|nr:TlpA family protein disulfide reductase [Alistipes sp.]
MVNISKFCIIIVAIAAFTFTGCNELVIEDLPTYEESSLVNEGDNAPLFSATLLDGTAVSLADYRGEYMMLILFSHTCPDCKMLLDDLQGHIDAEVQLPAILAIGRDATSEELLLYRSKHGYSIPMTSDASRSIFNLYATTYVPRVYLIDSGGYIVKMFIEYESHYLDELIEEAIFRQLP